MADFIVDRITFAKQFMDTLVGHASVEAAARSQVGAIGALIRPTQLMIAQATLVNQALLTAGLPDQMRDQMMSCVACRTLSSVGAKRQDYTSFRCT